MLSDEELLALQKDQQPDDSWLQTLAAEPEEPEAPSIADLIAQRGPDPEEGQYERKFSEENQPQASWKNTLGAIAAGIAESTGTPGAVGRFHDNQAGARRDFQQGLANARQRDNMHRFADPATIDMLESAGLSRQDAANTRLDSQALKLAPTLGQLDTRRRGQDMAEEQKMLSTMSAEDRQRERLAHQDSMQGERLDRADSRLDKTLAARKKPGGGLGAPMSPEAKAQKDASIVAYLAAQANVTDEQAAAFVAGQTEGIPADKLSALQRFASMFSQLPSKDQAKLLTDTSKREGATPDRVDASSATKRNDPTQLLKIKNEIDEKGQDIAAARNAWRKMSPGAKAAMAKYGGAGGTIARMIRQMSMSDQDRVYASELQNLANALIKAQSGAAVSEGEWGRLADRMGFASKDFDPLNSPATIENWINRMQQAAVTLKRNAAAVYGAPLTNLWGQTSGGR